MVATHVPDLKRPVYYLAGPPGMVTALKKLLLDRGVSRDNVRFETFSGY
jgi:ferredoxin-NADP reductase